jgi:uncharacterized protein (TIGR00730 family)
MKSFDTSNRPARIADRDLLLSPATPGWVDEDPWRVLRIGAEFVEGFEAMADLGCAVSVFGSARTKEGDPGYEEARQIAAKLAAKDITVITGGGPGMMEAANRGAKEAGGRSVGLGIELPHEQAMNQWVELGVDFHYFFTRKVMFLKYAQGFIVMPGGMGTFDELFEALTMVQTHKIENFPIVLFGSAYWSGLLDWLREHMLADGYISPGDLDYLQLTDDVDQAVAWATVQIDALRG